MEELRNEDLNKLMNELATEQDEPEPFPAKKSDVGYNNGYVVKHRYNDKFDESGQIVMDSSYDDEKPLNKNKKNANSKPKQIREREQGNKRMNLDLEIDKNNSFKFDGGSSKLNFNLHHLIVFLIFL